jgi:hypothetical protein
VYSEKYYGQKVIMKLCTSYGTLSEIIYAFTQFRTVTLMQETSEINTANLLECFLLIIYECK